MADPGSKRVKRLYGIYDRAQQKLDLFREEHEEIFERFTQLTNERNVALDQVTRAVRENGVGVGMMEVSVSNKRVFDGEYLYKKYKNNKALRSEILDIQFKVNVKGFDKKVQSGDIDVETAKRAVVDIQRSNRVLNAPKEMVVD